MLRTFRKAVTPSQPVHQGRISQTRELQSISHTTWSFYLVYKFNTTQEGTRGASGHTAREEQGQAHDGESLPEPSTEHDLVPTALGICGRVPGSCTCCLGTTANQTPQFFLFQVSVACPELA